MANKNENLEKGKKHLFNFHSQLDVYEKLEEIKKRVSNVNIRT